MNPRELFVSTLKREQSVKVPFFPRDLTLSLDSLNVPTDSVFGQGTYDSDLSARCVLGFQDMIGNDCTVGCVFTYGLDAFGGITKFPKDGLPYVSGYFLNGLEDIDSRTPEQILDGFLFKGMRRSCEIVREKRQDLALTVNVPGPVTMAGFMRGLENLLMDTALNQDLAEKEMKFATDATRAEMLAMADGIADCIFLASASDNPDILGIDEFVKYSVSNVRGLVSGAHSAGYPVIYHPHGIFSTDDREDILKESISTGIDGFQFSEGNEGLPIAEICKDKCSILGGVDSYTTLLLGPDARIVRDTRRFLDELSDYPYIMTCSCSVNRGLSMRNVKIMADTISEYNRGVQ